VNGLALRPELRAIALCAGVGGLDLGLRLALPHTRTVCYVEREAAAAASLVASMEAGWFHPAPVWSDMRTFDAGAWCGCVDIVTSGDPCQGNSVAGKRLGQLDDRWLLDRAIDIFASSGARYFFRENVPGNADGQLAVAVPSLERLGCRVASGVFSSAETGNTMRRERLFILAVADGRGGGHRDLQRGGQFGFQPQGDGASGSALELGGTANQRYERSGTARGRRNGSQNPGLDMVSTQGDGCGAWRPEHGIQQRGHSAASVAGGAMGSPIGSGNGGIEADQVGHPGGRTASDRSGAGNEPMGRSLRAELQGQQRGQHRAAGWQVKDGPAPLSGGTGVRSRPLPPAIIPGPTDRRWIDLLDRFPEYQPALSAQETESHLRRGVDAMANRIERLRATGNGVDPVVAAYAFLRLGARLDLWRD